MIRLTGLLMSLVLLCPATAGAGIEKGNTELASRILDADIRNEEGEKIGEIDDLVLKRIGKVKRVTLEVGGFFDFADKMVSVSFRAVNVVAGGVTLGASTEQLSSMPEFDYYESGLQPDYYYVYHRTPYYTPGNYGRQPPFRRQGSIDWAFSPHRFLASVIMNRRLITGRGETLGFIKDLVISDKGKVQKFIVSTDVSGKETHLAVPYQPLGFTPYGVLCDLTMPDFKDLPKYDYEE
jgi:sporulation protein YlmC with PRC-barrel domain